MTESRSGQEQAVEYLQTAAIEAIKAMRSFLDVAESLVREPEAAAVVGRAFAEAAASFLRPSPSSPPDGSVAGDEEDPPPSGVRRIDLSD